MINSFLDSPEIASTPVREKVKQIGISKNCIFYFHNNFSLIFIGTFNACKIYLTDYIARKKVNCEPKIRQYSTLMGAMTACSRSSDCKGVSQPCGDKENNTETYSTCGLGANKAQQISTAGGSIAAPHLILTFDDCETLVFYQKST